jgi:ribosomal protein L37AE/L43A
MMFYLIPFALFSCQFAVKRKAVGIWGCKDCGKVKAGGAYTMKYCLANSLVFPSKTAIDCSKPH